MPRDKVRRNEQRRKHYAANKELMRQRSREYRQKTAVQRRAATAQYRERHREKLRWQERLRRRDKLRQRAANLRYAHKLEERRLAVAGRPRPDICEICGEPSRRYRLHLDHCHIGGHFRGWICHRCNLVLGQVKDNVELLGKLTQYLIKTTPKETTMPKVGKADTHHRHPSSHHSDHSGAHVRGTTHHIREASNPADGLMPGEMPGASPGQAQGDAGLPPDGGTIPGGQPGGGGLPGM